MLCYNINQSDPAIQLLNCFLNRYFKITTDDSYCVMKFRNKNKKTHDTCRLNYTQVIRDVSFFHVLLCFWVSPQCHRHWILFPLLCHNSAPPITCFTCHSRVQYRCHLATPQTKISANHTETGSLIYTNIKSTGIQLFAPKTIFQLISSHSFFLMMIESNITNALDLQCICRNFPQ